jgi:hypothetical protein
MRSTALGQILLVMLAGIAGPGCAKEDMLMHKVDVHEVFTDTRVAELADAIADNDAKRVHALAKTTDLRAHGDKNVTLLEWAVFNQSKRAFDALLEEGADPTLPGWRAAPWPIWPRWRMTRFILDALLKAGLKSRSQGPSQGGTAPQRIFDGRRDLQFNQLLRQRQCRCPPAAGTIWGDAPLHWPPDRQLKNTLNH